MFRAKLFVVLRANFGAPTVWTPRLNRADTFSDTPQCKTAGFSDISVTFSHTYYRKRIFLLRRSAHSNVSDARASVLRWSLSICQEQLFIDLVGFISFEKEPRDNFCVASWSFITLIATPCSCFSLFNDRSAMSIPEVYRALNGVNVFFLISRCSTRNYKLPVLLLPLGVPSKRKFAKGKSSGQNETK